MFRRLAFLVATITVLLLAVIAFSLVTTSTTRAQSQQQWEYLFVIASIDSNNGGYTFATFPAADKESLDASLDPFENKLISITLGDQTIKLPDNTALTQALNTLGAFGWELVSTQPGAAQFAINFYFKRPL